MLIDLLDSEKYINVNLKLAQTIGLNAAIYCTELMRIYDKAQRKDRLIDTDYIKLDRKYISMRTTLSIEDQLKADLNLAKIGLLKKHVDNPDIIRIDLEMLASIIVSDDLKTLDDLAHKVKVNSPKGIKESQRHHSFNEIKNSIECSNYELLTALRGWVDGIEARPNAFLSKSAVKAFQETLNAYTQGDLDLALKIVEIATIQSYKDCQWAINVYEKSEKIKKQQQIFADSRLPRTTMQTRATAESLGEEIF